MKRFCEIPDQGMAEAADVTGQDASLDSVHVDVLVRAHKKVCEPITPFNTVYSS